jgi:hypothetical protein
MTYLQNIPGKGLSGWLLEKCREIEGQLAKYSVCRSYLIAINLSKIKCVEQY